jgi:osmotically-inducible protein OsmY
MTQTQSQADAQLKSAIVEELTWTPTVNSTHIGVSVDQGAVTLSGEVESFPERRLAEKAAMHVHGVTAIAEELTVRSDWGTANDTDIARDAGHALNSSVNVPSTVKAAVRDHRITLSGEVHWNYEREAAMQAVRYLKGVDGVVNSVVIRPLVSAGNLKKDIEAAYVRNAQIESRNLGVTADGAGVVILEGYVHTWTERKQAERLAWSAPGVTEVRNRLKIQF